MELKMSDKPKVKDLIDLSWTDLRAREDVRAATWEALGEPGPWEHVWNTVTHPWTDGEVTTCVRCEEELFKCDSNYTCPVPPPITEAVEVVARKLRDIAVSKGRQKLHQTIYCLDISTCVTMRHGDMEIWWFDAEPTEQILVCLLALGAIEE
jgi:hypothetical protein